MKRLLFFIAVFMTVALNAQTPWSGKAEAWTKGEGTAEDPFQIETAEHLAYLSQEQSAGNLIKTDHFILMNDLDLGGAPSQSPRQKWIPIGPNALTVGSSFKSKFDGNGKTISNLYVEMETDFAGLFGYVLGGEIKNLGIVGESYVSGTKYVGGIAGINDNEAVIINCYSNATVSGVGFNVGGITGRNSGGKIYNSYNTGNISNTANFVGGITGYNALGFIENCYNKGNITGAANYVGGIAGCNNRKIVNSYNVGTVNASGTAVNIGGITGKSSGNYVIFSNCHKLAGKVMQNGVVIDGDTSGEVKTESEMKTPEFVTVLNAEQSPTIWFIDSKTTNSGYPIFAYQIKYTLTVNAGENGTVTGGGEYANGSKATLTATPNTGYTFTKWNDDNVNSIREITVVADATYTAEFAPIKYTITATAGENGITTGTGEYDYNADAILTATANIGYSFSKWNDGNTDNPRTVKVIADATYVAEFKINSYTLTVTAGVGGTVTGDGKYDYNTTATLTAIADNDYEFNRWSDGNINNPRTVTVTANATYNAEFFKLDGVDNESEMSINIYPNPMQNLLIIEGEYTFVEIINVKGQVVLTSTSKTRINVNNLSNGIYIVKIYNNDKVGIYKIVKRQ